MQPLEHAPDALTNYDFLHIILEFDLDLDLHCIARCGYGHGSIYLCIIYGIWDTGYGILHYSAFLKLADRSCYITSLAGDVDRSAVYIYQVESVGMPDEILEWTRWI